MALSGDPADGPESRRRDRRYRGGTGEPAQGPESRRRDRRAGGGTGEPAKGLESWQRDWRVGGGRPWLLLGRLGQIVGKGLHVKHFILCHCCSCAIDLAPCLWAGHFKAARLLGGRARAANTRIGSARSSGFFFSLFFLYLPSGKGEGGRRGGGQSGYAGTPQDRSACHIKTWKEQPVGVQPRLGVCLYVVYISSNVVWFVCFLYRRWAGIDWCPSWSPPPRFSACPCGNGSCSPRSRRSGCQAAGAASATWCSVWEQITKTSNPARGEVDQQTHTTHYHSPSHAYPHAHGLDVCLCVCLLLG